MESSVVELIQELNEFLSVNRHHLTGEEIVLLNRIIEELKKANESRLDPGMYLAYVLRISELILRLFEMN